LLEPKRRKASNPAGGGGGSSQDSSSHHSGDTHRPEIEVELASPLATAGGHGTGAYQKPLQSKQNNASLTATPIHVSSIDSADALVFRGDAITTFATSINANQPVATILDRIRAYERQSESSRKFIQFLEVEGRAIGTAAYMSQYFRFLLSNMLVPPGTDAALPNTTQKFCHYNFAALFGRRKNIRVENVIKLAPFAGVGAQSAYSENDGTAAYDRKASGYEPKVASYFVARAYGANISSLYASAVKGFFISAPADINAGFTIKVGGRAYVSEEISDIEDRINQYFVQAGIIAAAGAGLRGILTANDPFLGTTNFMFGDLFDTAEDLSIVINTPQAIQVAVLTEAGIDSLST